MASMPDQNQQLRSNYRVMVSDVHAMGQIAVIRSLGRAGYRVHALSAKADALGLRSRLAEVRTQHPTYDDPGFCDWLEKYIAENNIDLIIPSEGFLWAVRPIFDRLAAKMPIRPEADFIYRMINKYDYFHAITTSDDPQVRQNCPDILYVDRENMPPDAELKRQISVMPFPCFIKMDAAHGRTAEDGDGIAKVTTPEEAFAKIMELAESYDKFLMQGYIPGRKAGINLLIKDGEVKAHYVMKATHETPHKGGVASLRHTWQHDTMLADAIAKMRHVGWNGALMVEYRWDEETDRFALVEINLRFWGYLHLCLYGGVDFPMLLADDHLGLDTVPSYPVPRPATARCLSFETGYLLSLLKDGEVGIGKKLGALVNFLLVGLNPAIYSDGFFPGDRGLWCHELTQTVRNLLK
ncbi:hypothetical protein [Emcibacter sp.]|uniref:hypothetical protein n=1 Tax=Emcibacter sp. TaxID=1979954 RepID=UPI003A9120BA